MSEVRQRWRIVFGRGDEARYLSHLDAVRAWERAFRRGEIPIATSEGFSPRSRLVFAAPLQLGMLAEHELADLFLAERLTALDLRRRLVYSMPRGYRVVDLYDVWTGAPALAPQLAAADYRMTLLNVERPELAAAVARLLAAEELPRERRKETRLIRYDLRPLLLGLRAGPADADAPSAAAPADADAPSAAAPADTAAPVAGGLPGNAAGLWMRLRHSQSRGSGRPDEVVASLAAELGMRAMPLSGAGDDGDAETGVERMSSDWGAAGEEAPEDLPAATSTLAPRLDTVRPVRERLWLDDELSSI